MTKKQLIALFEAMRENANECAKYAEESGNVEFMKFQKGQASAFSTAILALESPKYAREAAEIYEVKF
jgi:hypothetical protein